MTERTIDRDIDALCRKWCLGKANDGRQSSPREAIERNKPYEPPKPERNANGKFTYQVFAFPEDDIPDTESPVFECDNDDARRVAADYAAQWGVRGVELLQVRYNAGGTELQIIAQMGFIYIAQEPT